MAFSLALIFRNPNVQIFVGTKGAIQIAVDAVTKYNSNGMDVRHRFLRDLVEQERFKITDVEPE